MKSVLWRPLELKATLKVSSLVSVFFRKSRAKDVPSPAHGSPGTTGPCFVFRGVCVCVFK